MAKRIPKPAGSDLPDREQVLAFIASAGEKVGKREIAKAFNLKGAARIGLKALLKEIEAEGAVTRGRGGLSKAGRLPAVVLADLRSRDRDGEFLAVPVEWDAAHGKPPVILVSPPRRGGRNSRQPAPGIGDRALIRVEPDGERDDRYTGRVIKVIGKNRSEVIGVFRAGAQGGRILPVEKRAQGREILIPPGEEGEARDGDLVSVALERETRFGLPRGRVRERLGSLGSEKAVSLIALHLHNLPHVFAAPTLAEADAVKPATLKGREDWRTAPLLTIDPPDAKDHDDAVMAEADPDEANPGGFIVTVAIADVAAYVRPGSALDREALERGNSVYFPDRVVPMLPERISNDLCSLREGEDRPALAVRMVVGADGVKRRHSFHRVMMRSRAKLAYAQAQAAIDGRPDDKTGPLLEPVLRPLWAAYAALTKAREARGPLALDLPERKVILGPDGAVDRVIVPERLDAHRLIEEFMIQANVAAAETLEAARQALIYRVHDEPALEKMRALGEVLASVGIKLPREGALRPALFNRILASVAGSEHAVFINEVVLRSQAQAVYAAENLGHFGLNLRRYAHFTSPIRRYADLIVHRALITACRLGSDGLSPDVSVAELNQIGEQISGAERRAMAAERETVDRLIAHHLADQVGATFSGQISGVTRSGLFIKLDETGADGFVPVSTLGAEYFRHEEGRHALVGERSGESFRLGDRVEVRLVEAAAVAGALRFELLSEGRPRSGARPAAGGRRGSSRPPAGKAAPPSPDGARHRGSRRPKGR
ncbi:MULTISPECIES: ribonuclease R [Methylobacterium]|uniref:Ribonuclease R n=6 Tax=Pseudomonadota TaxID=1224 RepID=A0ABQ4SVJ6_9HYPH|nr:MULTISPECIES: ribonuclease R [Methylobacterium]PIU08720.1 MAG: ribonuclease R [Methylobacterium sp. CG09_land_8_20_14_0_10_71_15]PIU16294.1 MAG: ribonuclease R [Methylobacterium sp. CG08_land_8_20_14_0_20_71_15]GBU18284.1 exoribonuclease R [Methylobacterium sp.]GJE05928.1 Ribonuclease R [Methylobacterium jeotgali]